MKKRTKRDTMNLADEVLSRKVPAVVKKTVAAKKTAAAKTAVAKAPAEARRRTKRHEIRVPRQHRLAFVIYDVARAMRNINDEAVKPYGLTQSQWSLLLYLVELGDVGMMQTELGKLLNIGKVSIGGLCDRLERAGYIKRVPDDNDRRINRVFITESGLKIVGEVDEIGMRKGMEIAEGISTEHLKITMDVLLQMKEKMLDLLASD